MGQVASLCIAVLVAVIAGACAGPAMHPPPVPEQVVTAPAVTAPAGRTYRETGIASWYGGELEGHRTASGEAFDPDAMSAAHRTLPLGTPVRVTNLDTYQSATLIINDRGPFIKDRFLEVTFGAARQLGFSGQGTARVKVESLDPVADSGAWTVHAAQFSEEESARLLRERLTRRFEVVTIVPFQNRFGKFYRVRVGAYPTEEKAERIAAKLALDGLEPVVVRKD